MSSSTPDEALRETAYRLVQDARAVPSAAHRDRLENWRRLSPAHERAARAAERYFELLPLVDLPAPDRSSRIALSLQALLARLSHSAGWLAVSCAAAVALAATFLWSSAFDPEIKRTAALAAPETAPVRFATGPRETRTFSLSDGSTLWLGWDSAVEVEIDQTERVAQLKRGVAAFQAQTDPQRAFIVRGRSLVTRVTGTEFVVDQRSADRVSVAVIEGSVAVQSASGPVVRLLGAQQVTASNGRLGKPSARDPSEIGAWRDGLIVFRERPLKEALAVLAPYTSYLIDASALEDRGETVTATFFTDRGDDALETLLGSHGLITQLRAPRTLMVRHPAPRRP